jgi:3'(2'), 5'-bisphosphate nucleotidase
VSELDLSHALQVARELAKTAGQKVLASLNDPQEKSKKADGSIITATDLASNQLILEGLQQSFPDHSILTEESGLSDQSSSYVWVVDPLDGTKAFAKGIPGFCIMIGLLKDGHPILGVVYDPLEGHIYEAIQGQGTWHSLKGERQRVHCSSRDQLETMPLVISTGFPQDALKSAQTKLSGPLLDPINSVGIKVGLLVRQEGDIYLNHHSVHYWDTCAPQIILEEAGGIMTKLDGTPLDYELKGSHSHQSPTVATNNTRHNDIVLMIQNLIKDES